MQKTPVKKIMVILVLFQMITIFMIIPSQAAQNNALAVTPSTTQDTTPLKNTITDLTTKTNYNTIQDAIQHATKGSTLHIGAGTYHEILDINKPLTIIGAGAENTIIACTSTSNSYAIRISANDVTIQGIQVSNNGPGLYTTAIKITGIRTTIDHCDISDTPVGIGVWSSQNTIKNCGFTGCDDDGIVVLGLPAQPCTDNMILSCQFRQNCDGIELQYSSNTHIQDGVFDRNTHAGIDMIQQSNENTLISGCVFTSNGAFGVYAAQSTDTQITQCSFVGNKVTMSGSLDTTISQCQLETVDLFDGSSLTIQDCENFDQTAIHAIHSTYSIEHHTTEPDVTLAYSVKDKMTIAHRILTLFPHLKTMFLSLKNRSV